MPIFIRNPELEARIEAVARQQPVPTGKSQLIHAIIGCSITACEASSNPEAWRKVGDSANAPTEHAQMNNAEAPLVRGTPSLTRSRNGHRVNAKLNSSTPAKVSAGARR